MTLTDLKKELAEKYGYDLPDDLLTFITGRVLDAVEKEVVPGPIVFDPHSNRLAVSSSMNRTEGWEKCRERILNAFKTFRALKETKV